LQLFGGKEGALLDKENILPVYLRIWRSIVVYSLTAALVGLCCFLYTFFIFSTSDPTPQNGPGWDQVLYPYLTQSVIALMLQNSLIRVFAHRDAVMRDLLYPGADAVGDFKDTALQVLRCKLFWIECATLMALPILLPLECTLYPIPYLLFYHASISRALQKLILCAIVLPILFGMCLWHHTAAIYVWQEAEIAERPDNTKKLASPIASTCFVYAIALLFLPSIILILVQALISLAAFSVSLTGLAVICLLLAGFLLRYVRALRIRRAFVKNLRERCRKCGFELSKIKRPYASLFWTKKEVSFTVKANGKTYDCKLLAGLSRCNPVSISPDGVLHVIHSWGLRIIPSRGMYMATFFHAPDGRVDKMIHASHWHQKLEILRFTVKISFGFESDTQKVLIVNPVPISLFSGTEKRARLIDNGDRIGGYKVFAGTAFLNALERDCIDHK
jgi:hypothetical protein